MHMFSVLVCNNLFSIIKKTLLTQHTASVFAFGSKCISHMHMHSVIWCGF